MATNLHPQTLIFGAYGVLLRRAGLAVLPADGKRPIRSGFNAWKFAPSIAVVEQWEQQEPYANIAYIPGLSRTPKNPNGLVVVDADNSTAAVCTEEIFGRTPAMINTRRGRHFIYRAPDQPLGTVGSLRKCGFEIDIKHGQKGSGISVAPPSSHPDQTDFYYTWYKGSGPDALTDLPTFNIKALHDLMGSQSRTLHDTTYTAPPPGPYAGGACLGGPCQPAKPRVNMFRNGSRKLGLNDHLVAHAWAIDDFETCLDIARNWNDDLHDIQGLERLSDDKVVAICTSVMADVESGKIVRTRRQRAIAITDADEISGLLASNRNGDAALALLLKLRAAHGERCRRGGTFVLCVEAMVKARTMGTWAARKYREARNALLRAGLIELVSPARQHVPAQYRLAERLLTPGLQARKTR